MPYIATALVRAPNDQLIRYSSGKALTQIEAENELKKVLAVVVCKGVLRVSISFELDTVARLLYITGNPVAQFEDLEVVLNRVDAVLGLIVKVKKINNVDLSYKLPGRPEATVTNADLIAIATNYRDGSGIGGYTISALSRFSN